MAIEKKPANPVPPNYIPPNTKPYKVRDGDSWISIAQSLNINPWILIELNFKTDNPAEVNWYLRHYVGCTVQTEDHNNYRFSSSDHPGIIHIPIETRRVVTMPPIHIIGVVKKRVPVGWIEKERLYNVPTMAPGRDMWGGSKWIIREQYMDIPKDYVEKGFIKSPALYYEATGFSKTTICRYQALYGSKNSTAQQIMKALNKLAWVLVHYSTNTFETARGIQYYDGWNKYPKDSSDPMNKFRP